MVPLGAAGSAGGMLRSAGVACVRVAALLLLAAAPLPTAALMFHSQAVTKEWDTWVFVENGTYYAYYLVTEVSFGEGFGVATSTDGFNFTDQGYVWHGPSWWNAKEMKREGGKFWEGTSSVWRAADFNTTGRYLINYSVMDTASKTQNITFAESYDLIHWSNGLELNETNKFPWFDIDPSKYKVGGGRWDTIYSIPVPGAGQENVRDGYPRYGYWTATPLPNSSAGGKSGTFGVGITQDGFNWKALPAPVMEPPPKGGAELGAVEYVKEGVYVAMLGYGWPRTMLAYTATSPLGPFIRNAKNVNFLNGSCYYSRFFRGPTPEQELLVTHQTWDNIQSHYSYISPFKAVDVDTEGTFRLKWWGKNEGLKGEPMLLTPAAGSPFSAAAADVTQGAVMEATFTLPASANISTWPGFIVQKVGDVNSAYFIGMSNQGWATVGTYQYDPATKSGAVHPGEKWGRDLPLTAGEKVKARLLYRGGMLEMYINDYLFPVWSGVPGSGRLGVSDSSIVTGALAWKMSLPHTATPPVLPPPPPPRPPPPPPAPPPPPGPKLPVGTTGNGTCGATSFGGDCNVNPKGAWNAAALKITTLAQCVAKAKGCKMADYVSFSNVPGNADCSWYSYCDMGKLCADCHTCGIGCPKYYPYETEVVKN